MATEKQKEVARLPQKQFKPKNYKELVDWYVLQIESGLATKRDFVRLAKGLVRPVKPKKGKKAPEKPKK